MQQRYYSSYFINLICAIIGADIHISNLLYRKVLCISEIMLYFTSRGGVGLIMIEV